MEINFQEDNAAKSQLTLRSIRSCSFHENREPNDYWLDRLPHGENQSEKQFSINLDGDQMTPINVHTSSPKVIIEKKSEADNLTQKFGPGTAKKILTTSNVFGSRIRRFKFAVHTNRRNYVLQHQVHSTSAIKLQKLELSSFFGDPLE